MTLHHSESLSINGYPMELAGVQNLIVLSNKPKKNTAKDQC